MTERRKLTKEERKEIEDFQKSLRVASSLDQFYDAVTSGTTKEQNEVGSESNGFSIDFDSLSRSIPTDGLSHDTLNESSYEGSRNLTPTTNSISKMSKLSLSKNQAIAISKFPSLIEFLGKPEGEAIAKKVLSEINVKLAIKIEENSKKINQYATACVADKHNIKQLFKTDNYICVVTASGPFRGNEAICYDPISDAAKIIRLAENSSSDIDSEDVSEQFKFVHETEELHVNQKDEDGVN